MSEVGGAPARRCIRAYRQPQSTCYGLLVACVVDPNASQATIASRGEKRGPGVLETPLVH